MGVGRVTLPVAIGLAAVTTVTAIATPAGFAATAGEASCADRLRTEIDAGSFEGAVPAVQRPSAAQLETLRVEAERRFRAVAGQLCAAREMQPAAFRPFRRLLVQQGEGADNSVFFVGGDELGEDTLVFQAVFRADEAGRIYRVPDAADVRDGLLCWSDYGRNEQMCEERLP